ncbi:hypothetical protein E1293_04335 [Actinomadura darangshiensis]|uniref:Carboxypeptidase regulatory-like domain-containing protein n=1 Tax=Actinomadura darangshiensis TaxID=705336 RepID=A0A4R5BYY9_9ACTN|nr:hypothetical protein [Actinomadura darangshiensis]TDD89592.1 hypothetical protein E1293_04335 [Actinomadura darangshiensis]
MRRSSALLATAALTAGLLTVPATAHADVTELRLTKSFDRLDPERVLTLTVTAKSASGVTDVRANLRYAGAQPELYATLTFERVAGTANDGTWQARFHPDIDKRPGRSGIELLVTSADGATVTGNSGFLDCYETSVTDVTTGPDGIDADHPEVDLHGRVMVQKSRDVAPAPVPGTVVEGGAQKVTTGADGSFGVTLNAFNPLYVRVPAQSPRCDTGAYGKTPAIDKQATETSARLTTPQPVAIGTKASVQGTVLRHGAAGLVAAAGVTVEGYLDHGKPEQKLVARGWTSTDGTFTLEPTVQKSGPLTVVAADTAFLTGSQAPAGTLDARQPVQITNGNARPEPGRYGDALDVVGRLVSGGNGLAGVPMVMEFSTDRTTWKKMATANTYSDGSFYLTTYDSKKDGYWRARYAGSAEYMPAVSGTDYIDIKYRTQWYNFNASPEPVKKGGTITVKGQLYRFRAEAGPGPHAPVFVYFKKAGTTTYKQVATATTDSNGWFKKTFKASGDGTWMAVYTETTGYLKSTSQGDYVDVR